MIRAHLLRWRPRPHAQRTVSMPRGRPSGAASQLDPSHRSSRGSPAGNSVVESAAMRSMVTLGVLVVLLALWAGEREQKAIERDLPAARVAKARADVQQIAAVV